MGKIAWTLKAKKSFEYYADWYLREAGREVSHKLVSIIEKAEKVIKNNPYISRPIPEKPELREYILQKFPFIISYFIKDNTTIIITSFLHTKMKR